MRGLVTLRAAQVQVLRVECPHCRRGGCPVEVTQKEGEVGRIDGYKEPRVCDACGRLFSVKVSMHVEGVPVRVSPAAPHSRTPQGDFLRRLIQSSPDVEPGFISGL